LIIKILKEERKNFFYFLGKRSFRRCVGEQFFIGYIFLGSIGVQILEEIQFVADHCFYIGFIEVGTAAKTDNCKDKNEKRDQIFGNLHKYLSFQKNILIHFSKNQLKSQKNGYFTLFLERKREKNVKILMILWKTFFFGNNLL